MHLNVDFRCILVASNCVSGQYIIIVTNVICHFCSDVSDVTGAPEMLGGRVKTLHPAVHAGLTAVPTMFLFFHRCS